MGLLNMIFGKEENLKETVFIKDFSSENNLLKDMEELSSKVTSKKKKYIDKDIYLLKAGINGEKNVYYELKNSFIPMYCIHDIRIQHKDYIAQLDFLAITSKFIYVLETKKLIGDIQINSDGEFTRIIRDKNGRFIRKEGMASPISQNDKHINILKALLEDKKLLGYNIPIKSLVVIANPKTVVDKKYAKKEIKELICKYDNVADVLRKELEKESSINMSLKDMKKIADFLVDNNTIKKFDLYSKYGISEEDIVPVQEEIVDEEQEEMIIEEEAETLKIACEAKENQVEEEEKNVETENSEKTEGEVKLEGLLKDYRYNKCKELNLKPYYIFNNSALENLIKVKPKTIEELKNVSGFGEKNIEKYGQDILDIIKNYKHKGV